MIEQLIVPIIYASNLVLMLSMLLMERENPGKVEFWLLALLVLPIVGFVLYLFFGQTFYSRRRFRVDGMSDEIEREFKMSGLKTIDADEACGFGEASFARGLDAAGALYYSSNNDVKLYTDGNEKFDDLKADLRSAKRFIHMEYYIIRNDELGNEIIDILAEKASEGVEVRLMVDGIGYNIKRRASRKLMSAGGRLCLFHSTATVLLSPKKNNRNHRKIAVIDGEIGYIGGFNIGDEYLGKGPFGDWRDSAVRIRGSAVNSLGVRFNIDWKYGSGEDNVLNGKYYTDNDLCVCGDTPVQIANGGPDMGDRNSIAFQYLMMIEDAKESIWIHTPYFAPNEACAFALRSAAMRGVDVRIIIPDVSDHPFVYWANRKYANDVMRDGARVYEYNNGFVHSKTMVVDGRLCSIGSANFDDRSMGLNFEANAMVYSEELGTSMMKAFEEDLKRCTEYTREMYDDRTFVQRLKTGVSWLVSDQL